MSRSIVVVVLAVAALALGAPGCAPSEQPEGEGEPEEAAASEEMGEAGAGEDVAAAPSMAMPPPPAPYTAGQVNVDVTCPAAVNEAVTVSVNPWTYERSESEDDYAVWELDTNSGNQDIEVRPVRPGPGMPSGPAYPFMNNAPQSSAARLEVPKRQWRGQGTYHYEIVVKCPEISSPTDYYEVVLDPEMEIKH